MRAKLVSLIQWHQPPPLLPPIKVPSLWSNICHRKSPSSLLLRIISGGETKSFRPQYPSLHRLLQWHLSKTISPFGQCQQMGAPQPNGPRLDAWDTFSTNSLSSCWQTNYKEGMVCLRDIVWSKPGSNNWSPISSSPNGLFCHPWVHTAKSLALASASAGTAINDDDLVLWTMCGLGSEFDLTVAAINFLIEPPSFEEVCGLLLDFELCLNSYLSRNLKRPSRLFLPPLLGRICPPVR